MMPRILVFATPLLCLWPVTSSLAGDGNFGVPPSGVLPPPAYHTAALDDNPRPARNARTPDTTGSVVRAPVSEPEREPAPGAGRSRDLPQEPQPAPAKRSAPKRPQAKKPVPTVDPAYLSQVASEVRAPAPQQPVYAPAARAPQRGLFSQPQPRMAASYPPPAAAAAYDEYNSAQRAAPGGQTAQTAPQLRTPQGVRLSHSGTPCHELRGLLTSPPECR